MNTGNEHTQSHANTQPRSALFDPWLYLVVFCGGAVGSVLRYALSFIGTHLAAGSASGAAASAAASAASTASAAGSATHILITTLTQDIHVGTLVANLLACVLYAALATYLGAAPWIAARKRELTNRALGMGMCGGLSTMSTLSLEWFTAVQHGGNWAGALVYMALTVLLGLFCAGIGVWIGITVSGRHE